MDWKEAADSIHHITELREEVKKSVKTTRIPSITPSYEEKDAILASLRESVKTTIKTTKVPTIDPFEDESFSYLNGQRISAFIK